MQIADQTNVPSILDRFPKRRPELPPEFRAIYAEQYLANRRGATPTTAVSRVLEGWLHRQVARDRARARAPVATLEIGAGTLNHLCYEPVLGTYDIVEPFTALYQDAAELRRVRRVFADIADTPEEPRYDRIISIATFEHICNLPEVVAMTAVRLVGTGTLRVGIPSEGTILWTLGWKCWTGIEFRLRHGLDYGTLMRYEHVNTAREVEAVLRMFYSVVRCRVFGVSRQLSFYQFFECQSPQASVARTFLQAASQQRDSLNLPGGA